MITFDQAKQIALDDIGPDLGLIEDATIEKPYGWYFMAQSKAYIESGNHLYMLIGSGGFIVDKDDGRIYHFGSGYSLERNFEQYEAGFKYESYDLAITSVFTLKRTLDLLLKLRLTYVIPKFEYDVTWRIPQRYSRWQISKMLTKKKLFAKSPCVFADQKFYNKYDVFKAIDKSQCCEYQLTEHRDKEQSNNQPEG